MGTGGCLELLKKPHARRFAYRLSHRGGGCRLTGTGHRSIFFNEIEVCSKKEGVKTVSCGVHDATRFEQILRFVKPVDEAAAHPAPFELFFGLSRETEISGSCSNLNMIFRSLTSTTRG